jgi:hypothetical protein
MLFFVVCRPWIRRRRAGVEAKRRIADAAVRGAPYNTGDSEDHLADMDTNPYILQQRPGNGTNGEFNGGPVGPERDPYLSTAPSRSGLLGSGG